MNKNTLDYEMSGKLLPIHEITVFTQYEIINRMECLVNRNAEACEHFCREEHRLAETTLTELWKCYEDHFVSSSYYGAEQCDVLYDQETQYDENFYCKTAKKVPVTLKQACGVSEFAGAEKRLRCYEGKEIKIETAAGFEVVPFDKSYCQFENKILN